MIVLLLTSISSIFSRRNNNLEEIEEEESKKDALLCRFVFDGAGKQMGESISMDGDIIILKSGTTYLGVPIKHIEEDGKKLIVKGLVNLDKAIKMGEKWQKKSFRELEQNENEG